MPAADRYWDEAGLKNQSLSNGIFVSELTKEIEVLYINTKATHLSAANEDFSFRIMSLNYMQSHLMKHPEGAATIWFVSFSFIIVLGFIGLGYLFVYVKSKRDNSDDF